MSASAPTAITTKIAGHAINTFTLALATGGDIPTQIHLRDGTTIRPANDGTIQANAEHLGALATAGWFVKLT